MSTTLVYQCVLCGEGGTDADGFEKHLDTCFVCKSFRETIDSLRSACFDAMKHIETGKLDRAKVLDKMTAAFLHSTEAGG